jgi:salicylate hydroxylase
LYEKAHELRELGAGVVIGANGMKVYRELGLEARISDIAGRITTFTVKTWKGEELPGYRPPSPLEETYPLHRAEFQKLLFDVLPPGTVRLGRACVGAVEDADGVRIDFADGTHVRADVVIGADGIHSVLQSLVGAKSEPTSEGVMAYRGLLPADRLTGVYDMTSQTMWLGPGQSFLTFPVSAGRFLNLVAFVPTNLDVKESWSAPGEVADLAAAYEGWGEQVQQVIGAMDRTFRWGIYDREPLKTWSTDRITLLGDSAHAVTPHLGQGANQAVEDAITLAVLLQDTQADHVPARLKLYETLRIERTRAVRVGSREEGLLNRSTGLTAAEQSKRIVEIYDRLDFANYDAVHVAREALAAAV